MRKSMDLTYVQTGRRKSEQITRLVPIWGADAKPVGKPDKTGQKRLSRGAKLALDQLRNAVIDGDTAPPQHVRDIPRSVLVVPKDVWRNQCYSAGIGGENTTQGAGIRRLTVGGSLTGNTGSRRSPP
jgi:hypothetical protein